MECSWVFNPIRTKIKTTCILHTLKDISVCQCKTGGKATQETVSGPFEVTPGDKPVVHVADGEIYLSHRPPVRWFSSKHLSMCQAGNG